VKSPECSDCQVFATDIILATLMTCARSKYSWDIVVERVGNKVFLDKRDNSQFGELCITMLHTFVAWVYFFIYFFY